MRSPLPDDACLNCDGTGQVAVMRVQIVLDENGEPGGEWVGDSDRCPRCNGTGKAEGDA